MKARYILIVIVAVLLVAVSLRPKAGAQGPILDAAQVFQVFGPKKYVRSAGLEQSFNESFNYRGAGRCQLVVVNGEENGSKRVRGVIFLNGARVVSPTDFNQRSARIVKAVTPTAQNQLAISLSGLPGHFMTVSVECDDPPVILSAGGPGVSAPNPNTLLSALPIVNTGRLAAQNVRITSVTLNTGMLTTPAALPFNLGAISTDSSAVFNMAFSGGPFTPRNSYALTIQGTYAVGSSINSFTLTSNLLIPPASPGSAPLKALTAASNKVTGAPFKSQPPSFGNSVNRPRWTVPTGPFVPSVPTPTGTAVQSIPRGQANLPEAAAPIVFLENNGLGMSGSLCCAEPSGASNGSGVVFVSANWFAAYSMNSGDTFTQLDPTTIFPADAVGYCCDQIVQYVPSINRFIWLLQGNGVRIASASPADIISSGGTAWTYWNLTPDIFGQTGFDFPDLAVGNNFLYMSWNAFGTDTGHQVARTSLAGLLAGGTITIEFTNPADSPMAWFAHLCQSPQNEIFWAGHNNTSSMRVFSLAEGSGFYFWQDVGLSSWSNSGFSSTTPDGQDWLTQVRNVGTWVAGATRVGNQIWFAWAAGTDNNFRQPHVEMVTLDRSDGFRVLQQVQIWNNDYAFAYPALETNACTGEVGLSLEYGGNGHYENHVVGFWGDFIVYLTTGTNVGITRFGDYVTLRREPPTNANPGNLFSAYGYGLNSIPPPGSGTMTDIRHVLFGRPASTCTIIR